MKNNLGIQNLLKRIIFILPLKIKKILFPLKYPKNLGNTINVILLIS